MNLPLISYRRVYYIFSGIFLLGSIASLLIFGLRFGIDFRGGSLLEIEFAGERPSNQIVREELAEFNIKDIQVKEAGEKGMILNFTEIEEELHQNILTKLREKYGQVTEKRFEAVGPAIGRELKKRALYAIFTAVIAIILYIAWAFRKVSRPITSWRYGVIAVLVLIHDVLIVIGTFSLLGRFMGKEIDLSFIAAILTVFGYSVNDTIVVFDRIRENLLRTGGLTFPQLVNKSVNETLIRSINTNSTVVLVLAAVYFFGGETLRSFSLALIIGITAGTYSSIFLASPFLVSWEAFRAKRSRERAY